MNQHSSHNSSFQQQRQTRKRWRDDNEQNDRRYKSSKPNHQQHQSWLSARPMPSLSTSRDLYERDFPLYKQPVEVGSFSLDSERRFFNDSRQLRYYVEPEKSPHFDLRDGYGDRYIKRDESVKEKLDHILRWILANRTKLTRRAEASSSLGFDVDFVTWRGHLTKLLTTPYETREGWLLAVTKFKGTLYVSEVETDAARRDRETRTGRHQEMMYWGYKFEQFMCADKMDGSPDSSGVVNTNEAFCTVVQTRLSDHRLLFSGEVDCRDKDPNAPAPPACYVELKTSAEISTPKQRSNFYRFKLLKWWAQSFLPGVPRVVAGFRDDDGVVISVETFHISKISRLIKAEDRCWKPTVCMNFCGDFLTFVKCVATEDDPRVVYLFCWNPRCDVTYSVHRDSSYSFLPDWPALYRGWFPVISSLCCSNFVYFYTFNTLKRLTVTGPQQSRLGKDLLMGIVSGAVNVILTTPMWVVNTRLKLQGAKFRNEDLHQTHYKGIFDAFSQIIANEGVDQIWVFMVF